jgi:glycogen operon protein
MGDEMSRTQRGINNAYCQDNAVSWLNWQNTDARDRAFREFLTRLIRLRRDKDLLRQPQFLHGDAVYKGLNNVTWLRADGQEMAPADWGTSHHRSVAMMLADRDGDALLLLVNAYHEDVPFTAPALSGLKAWRLLVDTGRGLVMPGEGLIEAMREVIVAGRSQLLLEAVRR